MHTRDIPTALILAAARAFHEGQGPNIEKAIFLSFPYCPPKVARAAIDREYKRGLLECGVSDRTGWLTDKGRARLAEIES